MITDYDRVVSDLGAAISRNSALCDERDKAIRERDELQAERDRLYFRLIGLQALLDRADCTRRDGGCSPEKPCLRCKHDAAVAEIDRLRALLREVLVYRVVCLNRSEEDARVALEDRIAAALEGR